MEGKRPFASNPLGELCDCRDPRQQGADMSKVVLVTGSTGRVGKEVVARLSKMGGFTVRAATRDKADYAKRLGAHETVMFDLTDDKTWAPAMEGVTHLFSRWAHTPHQ
jgi:nucleoside-diphosphate-sugar epimerase